MKLRHILLESKRAHQFRGETSSISYNPHISLPDILKNIQSGEYHGRYFCWDDAKNAATYSGAKSIIECDIDPQHIIVETGLMSIIDDYTEHDVHEDVELQQKAGVPTDLTIQYLKFVKAKRGDTTKNWIDAEAMQK